MLGIKRGVWKGQAYHDKIAISQKDYLDLKEAGFINIEKVEIIENEYYKTESDLLALLLKVPILDDFSEINNKNFQHQTIIINKDSFDQYVKKYKTSKGILLKRRLYGIVAKK